MMFGLNSIPSWTNNHGSFDLDFAVKMSTVMRALNVVIGIAGILAIVAVASVIWTRPPPATRPKAEAVADAAGILHVPYAYHTAYQVSGRNCITPNGAFLYQIHGNASKLVGYATEPDGSLDEIISVRIPHDCPQGLAAFSLR